MGRSYTDSTEVKFVEYNFKDPHVCIILLILLVKIFYTSLLGMSIICRHTRFIFLAPMVH
jgi:hypothetical protein